MQGVLTLSRPLRKSSASLLSVGNETLPNAEIRSRRYACSETTYEFSPAPSCKRSTWRMLLHSARDSVAIHQQWASWTHLSPNPSPVLKDNPVSSLVSFETGRARTDALVVRRERDRTLSMEGTFILWLGSPAPSLLFFKCYRRT